MLQVLLKEKKLEMFQLQKFKSLLIYEGACLYLYILLVRTAARKYSLRAIRQLLYYHFF